MNGEMKKKHGVAAFFKALVRRYIRHDIPMQSAALTYYLLFAIFPILFFVSVLIGRLPLDLDTVSRTLSTVLPSSVVTLCRNYLYHVSLIRGNGVFAFSIVVAIYFPVRAANCLLYGVRKAYGLGRPKHIVRYYLSLLLYTVFLFVLTAALLMMAVVGRRVLGLLSEYVSIPVAFMQAWHYMRFAFIALLLFAALGLLYTLVQDRYLSARSIVPGTLLALLACLLISVGFSYYVEYLVDFSVFYGALGAVVILLLWLFLNAEALLMGAEVNAVISRMKDKESEEGEQ